MRSIEVTYDIVTEESAEHGDFAEIGYASPPYLSPMSTWEDGEVASWKEAYESSGQPIWTEKDVDEDEDVLEEAANFIAEYGTVEPSSYPPGSGTWYTVVDVENEEPRYSFHLKGFSHNEEREVYEWLKADHYVL